MACPAKWIVMAVGLLVVAVFASRLAAGSAKKVAPAKGETAGTFQTKE